jgi:hypothetical protein
MNVAILLRLVLCQNSGITLGPPSVDLVFGADRSPTPTESGVADSPLGIVAINLCLWRERWKPIREAFFVAFDLEIVESLLLGKHFQDAPCRVRLRCPRFGIHPR